MATFNPTKYAAVVQKARMFSKTSLKYELKPHYQVPESRMLAFRLPSLINGRLVYPDEIKV